MVTEITSSTNNSALPIDPMPNTLRLANMVNFGDSYRASSSVYSPDIQTALESHRDKRAAYKLYIDYYEGLHRLNFASAKWRSVFGSLFNQFADNLCAPIIDAAADRLKVTGFTVTNDSSATSAIKDIWRYNRMDRKAGAVHEHALKAGDAYVIVWPDDNGQPSIYPNPAHEVCVHYNDEDSITWASKLWQIDTGQWCLTLYYPNRVEKYVTTSSVMGAPSKSSAFRARIVPGERWPLPNPYARVPVFHFANKPEMGVWGQSELWNIVPLQDGLNKSIADMLVAMEYMAMPQRWATGLEVPIDPISQKPMVPFETGVDHIFSNPDENGRFGQFEQARIDNFSQIQNDFRLEMARISRTPLHYLSLGGNSQSSFVSSLYPSGESIKVAEEPFVSKLEDRQTTFGDVWEDVVAFCLLIKEITVDPSNIDTIWKPAALKSEATDLDNASKKKALGIPDEIIWAELGYTPEQIAEMKSIASLSTNISDTASAASAGHRPVRDAANTNATGNNGA